MTRVSTLVPAVALALTLAACGDVATLPVSAGTGPQPALPPPNKALIPTVNIAPAKGWACDTAPVNVLTGFLSDGGDAFGQPVGVALDKGGALLVADDVGNVVWRVSARP